ncbi:MAG: PIN domain-containing protein [Akkermansiaceae bacterium]|nr:PIN domain-containing protein [Akkermansiaceae bacterium]
MSPPDIRSALDTSVVIRLLTGQPADQAGAARSYMAEIERSGGKVYVSNLVVTEAYFACQHHYGMPKAEVLGGLLALLAMSTFVVHPQLAKLLSMPNLASAKPGFLDRLIHAEAASAHLPLVTFETAAARLADTRLLKPL